MLEKPLKTCTALKEWAEETQKNLFSRRLDESGNTMIDVAVTMAIGLIVLVAIFSLAPLIGSNIDSARRFPPNRSGTRRPTRTSPRVSGSGNRMPVS